MLYLYISPVSFIFIVFLCNSQIQPVISDSESDDDFPLVGSMVVIVATVYFSNCFFSINTIVHWII